MLQEQIFPNCEKLGQTIIFTRTRAEAARLHQMMAGLGYKCTSLRVRPLSHCLRAISLHSAA